MFYIDNSSQKRLFLNLLYFTLFIPSVHVSTLGNSVVTL